MYVDETWDGTAENAASIVNKFLAFNITAVYQTKWTKLTKNPDRSKFMERPRILINTLHGPVALFQGMRVTLDVDGVLTIANGEAALGGLGI